MDGQAHINDSLTAGAARVRVRGAVQGVGFRPFIWGLAHQYDLTGSVYNDPDGVLIEVEGTQLQAFVDDIAPMAPPLARIDAIEVEATEPAGVTSFEIVHSEAAGGATTAIPADAAVCDDCLAEIRDPNNRRYGYAFTNCTNCGPRYTITTSIPYDRAQTSMADFDMCPSCQAEYDDPADRRFHAQPNACPECGPQLSHDISEIAEALQAGQVVALKGIGGFHLVVDACNGQAVEALRTRKRRDGKPFAVMVADLAAAKALTELSDAEATLLQDTRRPVVICRAVETHGLADGVSNGLPTVGLMLPYTPLHHLLFDALPHGTALVMTSANLSGTPLITDNAEAEDKLSDIADLIVSHNRDIVIRADDSVGRIIAGQPRLFRRARGYTPEPVRLSRELPPILAFGGHLKNTICVTRGDEAFLSQHVGDLDSEETVSFLQETVDHLLGTLEVQPEIVACDLHPDFRTTQLAQQFGVPVVPVQHHHAHIAAVAAEHHVEGPLLGVALDGFGYGTDGGNWGGELLLSDGAELQRLGQFAPLALPGGDKAARAPWRMGASALQAMGQAEDIHRLYADREDAPLLAAMLDRGVNCPPTSSAGRLFDAACGLLRLKDDAAFEGEAPMALEGLVTTPEIFTGGWNIVGGTLSLLPLLAALRDMSPERGANVFHGTLSAALADWIDSAIETRALPRRIALGGGCFQNKVLTEALLAHLKSTNIEVFLPQTVPANDGGLSLGQAWVAAHNFN